VRLTWLGHSTVLLETGGVRVLADPLLRHRTGALWRAVPLPAVTRDLAGSIDVVLISHLHHDHCDLPSLRFLRAPVVLAPPGSSGWLTQRQVPGAVDVVPGQRVRVTPDVSVTAVLASHSPKREPFGPSAPAVMHVVEGPDGAAWLAGDTALDPAMGTLAGLTDRGQIDVAAIPVWGWGPNLGPGHLDPRAAAEAVALARVRHAVPVHWGTLHPAGMRRAMGGLLRTPGPRFASFVADAAGGSVLPHVVAVGEPLDVL